MSLAFFCHRRYLSAFFPDEKKTKGDDSPTEIPSWPGDVEKPGEERKEHEVVEQDEHPIHVPVLVAVGWL